MDSIWSDVGFLSAIFYRVLIIAFVGIVFYWFYHIHSLMKAFLVMAKEIISGELIPLKMPLFFHAKQEIKGTYKGREIVIGIIFSGLKNEFLPMPYIQLALKETFGYNISRLPHYASIEKNMLISRPKVHQLWGAFDRNFAQLFSRKYFVIHLERLISVAEDLERGRSIFR